MSQNTEGSRISGNDEGSYKKIPLKNNEDFSPEHTPKIIVTFDDSSADENPSKEIEPTAKADGQSSYTFKPNPGSGRFSYIRNGSKTKKMLKSSASVDYDSAGVTVKTSTSSSARYSALAKIKESFSTRSHSVDDGGDVTSPEEGAKSIQQEEEDLDMGDLNANSTRQGQFILSFK